MTKFISGVSLNGAPLSHVLFVDPEIGEAVLAEEYWLPLERRGEPIEDPSSLWGFQTLTVKGQITVVPPVPPPPLTIAYPEVDFDLITSHLTPSSSGGVMWPGCSPNSPAYCTLCNNDPCVCCCHP